MKLKLFGALSTLALIAATPANAASIAVFGNNGIGNLYAQNHSVTFVTDAQLATTGFLDKFDSFIYTRNGYQFGASLSAIAARNVKNFVTGNVVLFAGDFADDIGTANTNRLFNNALSFALGGAGKSYIGEFNGAMAAYKSNVDNFQAIGLINGAAGKFGIGNGGSDGNVQLTTVGAASPITAGVTFPYNPGAVEFGFNQSGYNPDAVIAQFSNGTPAILAAGAAAISAVPEPATWAMMVLGFGAVGSSLRSRRRRLVVTFA